jgi:hypothetical protein
MIVLHPTEEQYAVLNGYKHGLTVLTFALDGSNRYVCGLNVLEMPEFAEIHDQLNELERIEYTPFPPEPEI